MNKRYRSLRWESAGTMLLAALLSIILYYGLNYGTNYVLTQYFQNSDYIERATDRTAQQLQDYIAENQLQTTDKEKLDIWSRKQLLVYYVIFQNGKSIYDSAGSYSEEEAGYNSESEMDYLEGVRKHTIEFADGAATVYLIGFFDYQFYDFANYIELGIAIAVFMILFLLFLQKKIRYLRQLEQEVHILEGGGMDKQITIKGRDELTELAAGLDQMRLSLNESMQEKEELLEANTSLVTGMAHDLRTPLTTLLLYTELLQKGKYKNEEQMQQYLEKTAEKAVQIKHMSDQLFERFYVSDRKQEPLEPMMPAEYVLRDEISDFIMFLESQNYTINCEIKWPNTEISVITEYMGRIFDNISSNLLKYADHTEPITITLEERRTKERKNWLVLAFRNKIEVHTIGRNGTHVGIRNMEQMMRRMGGNCQIEKEKEIFILRLFFTVNS